MFDYMIFYGIVWFCRDLWVHESQISKSNSSFSGAYLGDPINPYGVVHGHTHISTDMEAKFLGFDELVWSTRPAASMWGRKASNFRLCNKVRYRRVAKVSVSRKHVPGFFLHVISLMRHPFFSNKGAPGIS